MYTVRKHLKALKQDGLIDSDLYVDQGEERPLLIRGYVVTKKGIKTSEYKLANELERQLCKEYFKLDIGEVNEINYLFDELFVD